jgi:hypothetical protein
MPIALDHAKRDDGDQKYENQAHVLVPPLVGRKLAECAENRKGAREERSVIPKDTLPLRSGFRGVNLDTQASRMPKTAATGLLGLLAPL